jgi:hypothetical protein
VLLPKRAANKFLIRPLKDQIYVRNIHQRPSSRYRKALVDQASRPDFPDLAEQLCRDGALILPSYFSGDDLKGMQDDFARWTQNLVLPEDAKLDLTSSYLPDSAALSKSVFDPFLMSLVRYYWGKPVYFAETSGTRLEPLEIADYSAWQWHHDAKRMQVKVMIVLTDVPDDGQRMFYLAGTHRLWHGVITSYEETRVPNEVADKYGAPIECYGPAGSVVIFDTNGIHRGNRTLGSRRDTWTHNYTAGRGLSPLPGLHPEVIPDMTLEERIMTRTDRIN